MMRSGTKPYAVIIIMLGLMLVGCGGSEQVKSDAADDSSAPAWVARGAGAFTDPGGPAFIGVGASSGIKNLALLKSNADSRARAELSKVFQFYTASMTRDYLATKMQIRPTVSEEEQRVEQKVRDLTSSSLSNIVISEQWHNRLTGEYYAMARLDLDAFVKSAEKCDYLDEDLKDYIEDKAEKLHTEIGKGFGQAR